MTIKEAILRSLEDTNGLTNYLEIYEHIISKSYYDFRDAKTPSSTISALLGDFIRLGDTRVKRIKQPGGTFSYYLTKNEASLDIENIIPTTTTTTTESKKAVKAQTYEERDLHKLLTSFLKTTDIYSKTIYHEQSNRTDEHQKWIHPDVVGIKFLQLQTNASQTFLKAINRVDTFKISSYEVKKEINSDYELKSLFFKLFQIPAGQTMDI
jgi:uncharacterized protein